MLEDRDREHERKLAEWEQRREEQHKKELERIQNMLMTELREMSEKQSATQVKYADIGVNWLMCMRIPVTFA